MTFEQILIYIGIPLIGFGITAGFKILLGSLRDLRNDIKALDEKIQSEAARLDGRKEDSIRRLHQRIDIIAKDLHDTEITVAGFPGTFICRNECEKRHAQKEG